MILTPTPWILYEVDFNDLYLLPTGTQVLKKGAHGGYFLQQTGFDTITFSPGAQYFLFKAPPLKVQAPALEGSTTT